MKNGNMPVTPIFNDQGTIRPFTNDEGFSSMATGLSKREAFAMAAMQGLLAEAFTDDTDIARKSVKMADRLLKELEK